MAACRRAMHTCAFNIYREAIGVGGSPISFTRGDRRVAAVIVFITGGFSVLGYAMTLFGLVIVPPIVLGGAVLIGIADIYLDFRKRSEQLAAS